MELNLKRKICSTTSVFLSFSNLEHKNIVLHVFLNLLFLQYYIFLFKRVL